MSRRAPLLRTGLALALAASLVRPAAAQVVRAFTPRYTTNDNGDITLIGNTLLSCNGGGSCNNGRNGNGGNVDNNNFTMVYVDTDADASTFCSSSATLTMPAGASVLWAGLYWGGESASAARANCRFSTPATGYQNLTATQLDVSGNYYQGFVDVTARVQASGNGIYWMGNVTSTVNSANHHAGWALVVVYRLATDPTRNLVAFDGFAHVAPGATVNLVVNGFLTPPAGAVNTRLGVVAGEGDLGLTGDSFRLNATNLSDAVNPATNFFNSTVSRLGARVATKNPNYANQLGWDVDLVSANGILPNGATGANIALVSTGDRFLPGVVTFATDLYQPVFNEAGFTKSVTDLNGGPVRPGDVLEYLVTVRNDGNDASTATVVRDTLPANASFVAGSLSIATGANAGAKTDAAGDDQAEYVAASRSVVMRLGTGATAAGGGTLNVGVSTSFRFRVTVNSPSPTGTVVSNQAALSCVGAQSGSTLLARSDGDGALPGVQPTDVTVTSNRITGTVFEDANYGGGAGRALAAAGGAGRPGARVELYDAAGAFAGADTTDAAGLYVFDGWAPGTFTVRVVNASVTSSRPGATPALLGVQTFRTNASTGTAVADPARVGGEIPSRADAAANTTNQALAALTTASATAQSVAPATLGTADVTGVDFGFNFDTIVNANNAGQGSLRQFILNSNALGNAGLAQAGLAAGVESAIFMVSDGLAHPGLAAGLPNLLTSGVVSIAVTSTLPPLAGDAASVDGGSQTANVGNTNAATLGSGGSAGVGALAVPQLAGPEVEIRDAAGLNLGLNVQASNVTLARLAVWGFGNGGGADGHADVSVGATAANVTLDRLALGVTATSFTDPGPARSRGDHVRVVGGDDGAIRDCLIAWGGGSGVSLTAGSDRWQVTGCEIRGNAIGNPARDGVSIEASASAVLRGDVIASTEGCGVDTRTSSGANILENLTISRSGLGAGAAAQTPGIRLGGASSVVDRCVVFDNVGAGLLAMPTSSANTFTRNSIYSNGVIANNAGSAPSGQIGIDLLAPGQDEALGASPFVTLNDAGDADAGANGLANFPVLESAVVSNGSFTLSGWARPGSTIELFVADPDPSGFGEGKTWVATFTEGSGADLDAGSSAYSGTINGLAQGADNTTRFRFTVPLPPGVVPGGSLTATATLASATSEFSGLVTVTSGVSVSGWVYDDGDHDAARDPLEPGTGASLFAKLVSAATPLSAQQVVSVNPGSGAYGFGFVSAGSYTIVLDDNGTASDVTPALPAGWIGTEAGAGTRAGVSVVGASLADENFGLWHGSRVDGAVFRDDGAGGGLANDGARQGGEAGVPAARVRALAAACAGGACDSALTDATGTFALWLPFGAAGTSVTLSESNPSGWLSTGGDPGSTGGAYSRAADAFSFTPASGVVYGGAAFGDVPLNSFAANGAKSVTPGGTAIYSHTFTAGSAGLVTLSSAQNPVPAIPGWTVTLHRDLDCDGTLDPGEPLLAAPVALAAGQTLCVIARHASPAGGPAGANESATLTASFSYTGAAPALSDARTLVDLTTLAATGGLQLVKSVDLASARPGDTLTYTIAYANPGPDPLSSITIQDATPAYTVFVDAGCGALGAGLAGCAADLQPAPGATGALRWTLSGTLLPGASGSVTFRVRVQ